MKRTKGDRAEKFLLNWQHCKLLSHSLGLEFEFSSRASFTCTIFCFITYSFSSPRRSATVINSFCWSLITTLEQPLDRIEDDHTFHIFSLAYPLFSLSHMCGLYMIHRNTHTLIALINFRSACYSVQRSQPLAAR